MDMISQVSSNIANDLHNSLTQMGTISNQLFTKFSSFGQKAATSALQELVPVQIRGQKDIGAQGQLRDAGEGNVYIFKNCVRLKRPAANPLLSNELQFTPSIRPTPAINQIIPQQAPSFTSFLGREAQAADWKSTLNPAESFILQHESNFNPTAQNPNSSAFGIWQGLASTRAAYAAKFGFDPNTTDPTEQLQMFRAYIKDRYGTPENARAFWQANHWY